MSYPSIDELMSLPDKTQIQGFSGKVERVFEKKAGKVPQNMIISCGGKEMRCAVWDHPDCSVYEGKEVIILPGGRGGLAISDNDYQGKVTRKLSISKSCTFQVVAVHAAAPAQRALGGASGGTILPTPASSQPSPVIRGEKVGMAINNAILIMTEQGVPFSGEELHKYASEIIKVSQRLEAGELAQKKEDVPF